MPDPSGVSRSSGRDVAEGPGRAEAPATADAEAAAVSATADSSAGTEPGSDGGAGGSADGEDPEAAARGICLRLLTSAPRTRAQLAQALRRREVDDDVAETVLGRFSEVGLIDDAAFADAWVDTRHAGRGLGRKALAAELRRRGVDDDTVRDAVDELSADDEEEMARRLARRKLGASRKQDATARARRALGMLARKGYSAGLAYRVVREELEAEGADVELPDPEVE